VSEAGSAPPAEAGSGRRLDYLEVVVAASPGASADLASEALFAAGASGLEEATVIADDRVRLTAFLPASALPLDALPLARCGAVVLSARAVIARDWEAEWLASLRPILLGEGLAIVPASLSGDALTAALAEIGARRALRIDPGMGFGSGSHATTALSAGLLEETLLAMATSRALAGTPVLDVGTGSGILGIAAHALGARPVLAIDVDPLAVDEAARNAAANGCVDGFSAETTPLDAIHERYPVVVANLDAPTLKFVHEALRARVAPGGALVISGLRERESWPVPKDLTLERTVARDGWRAERWRAP